MEALASAAHTQLPEFERFIPALHAASGAGDHPALKEIGNVDYDLYILIYLWFGIFSALSIIGIPLAMKAWTARKDWINFEENPKAFQESFAAYR